MCFVIQVSVSESCNLFSNLCSRSSIVKIGYCDAWLAGCVCEVVSEEISIWMNRPSKEPLLVGTFHSVGSLIRMKRQKEGEFSLSGFELRCPCPPALGRWASWCSAFQTPGFNHGHSPAFRPPFLGWNHTTRFRVVHVADGRWWGYLVSISTCAHSCHKPPLTQGGGKAARRLCIHKIQSLFLHYYLIVLFPIQTTAKLLLPHPVYVIGAVSLENANTDTWGCIFFHRWLFWS